MEKTRPPYTDIPILLFDTVEYTTFKPEVKRYVDNILGEVLNEAGKFITSDEKVLEKWLSHDTGDGKYIFFNGLNLHSCLRYARNIDAAIRMQNAREGEIEVQLRVALVIGDVEEDTENDKYRGEGMVESERLVNSEQTRAAINARSNPSTVLIVSRLFYARLQSELGSAAGLEELTALKWDLVEVTAKHDDRISAYLLRNGTEPFVMPPSSDAAKATGSGAPVVGGASRDHSRGSATSGGGWKTRLLGIAAVLGGLGFLGAVVFASRFSEDLTATRSAGRQTSADTVAHSLKPSKPSPVVFIAEAPITSASTRGQAATVPATVPASQRSPLGFTAKGVRVEVVSVKRDGRGVKMELTFLALDEDVVLMIPTGTSVGTDDARPAFYDDQGLMYKARSATIGSSDSAGYMARSLLIQGVRTRGSIAFYDVPTSVKRMVRLDILGYGRGEPLRNVTIDE